MYCTFTTTTTCTCHLRRAISYPACLTTTTCPLPHAFAFLPCPFRVPWPAFTTAPSPLSRRHLPHTTPPRPRLLPAHAAHTFSPACTPARTPRGPFPRIILYTLPSFFVGGQLVRRWRSQYCAGGRTQAWLVGSGSGYGVGRWLDDDLAESMHTILLLIALLFLLSFPACHYLPCDRPCHCTWPSDIVSTHPTLSPSICLILVLCVCFSDILRETGGQTWSWGRCCCFDSCPWCVTVLAFLPSSFYLPLALSAFGISISHHTPSLSSVHCGLCFSLPTFPPSFRPGRDVWQAGMAGMVGQAWHGVAWAWVDEYFPTSLHYLPTTTFTLSLCPHPPCLQFLLSGYCCVPLDWFLFVVGRQ